jgi:hypothetical protein
MLTQIMYRRLRWLAFFIKVLWHAATLFVYFVFFLHFWLLMDILYMMKPVADDLLWRLAWNRWFPEHCNGEFVWGNGEFAWTSFRLWMHLNSPTHKFKFSWNPSELFHLQKAYLWKNFQNLEISSLIIYFFLNPRTSVSFTTAMQT